jgi:hypothetical protein
MIVSGHICTFPKCLQKRRAMFDIHSYLLPSGRIAQ